MSPAPALREPQVRIFRAPSRPGYILLDDRSGGEHFALTLRGARRLAARVLADEVADPGYSPWRFTRGDLVEEVRV